MAAAPRQGSLLVEMRDAFKILERTRKIQGWYTSNIDLRLTYRSQCQARFNSISWQENARFMTVVPRHNTPGDS
jgi:hypothetical protein